MVRHTALLLFGLYGAGAIGADSAKDKVKDKLNDKDNSQKIQPLSEQFLLFLAQMEDVEGELVHPVDLDVNNDRDKIQASAEKPQSKTVNKAKAKREDKDGKTHDDN